MTGSPLVIGRHRGRQWDMFPLLISFFAASPSIHGELAQLEKQAGIVAELAASIEMHSEDAERLGRPANLALIQSDLQALLKRMDRLENALEQLNQKLDESE